MSFVLIEASKENANLFERIAILLDWIDIQFQEARLLARLFDYYSTTKHPGLVPSLAEATVQADFFVMRLRMLLMRIENSPQPHFMHPIRGT